MILSVHLEGAQCTIPIIFPPESLKAQCSVPSLFSIYTMLGAITKPHCFLITQMNLLCQTDNLTLVPHISLYPPKISAWMKEHHLKLVKTKLLTSH